MPRTVVIISVVVGFLVLGGAVAAIVNQSFSDPDSDDDESAANTEDDTSDNNPLGHGAAHGHISPALQVGDVTWNLSTGPAELNGTIQHDHPAEVVIEITAQAPNGTWLGPVIVNSSAEGLWNWTTPYTDSGIWTLQIIASHPPESTASPAAIIKLNLTGTPGLEGAEDDTGQGDGEGTGGSGDNATNETVPMSEICLDGHINLAQHIHPTIYIYSDATQISIPADIGIDTWACPSAMHIAHTHDDTGRIHVETHEPMDVTLGIFFEIWGEVFNSAQVLDLYADSNHTLTMSVDGVEVDTWQETIFTNGQVILIEHSTIVTNDTNGSGGGDNGTDGNGSNGTGNPPGGSGNSTNETIYDAADLGQFWLDFFLCQDGNSAPIDDYNTTGFDGHVCDISVTLNETHVIITSNGLPEHDLESGPGCCASEQEYIWSIPRSPTNDTMGGHDSTNCPSATGNYECAPERGPVSIAVDGVPFYGPEDGPGGDAVANHHGAYEEDRQQIWLGVCHGHSGPGGAYHYHADANCVHWHADADAGEVMLDYDLLNSTNDGNHSKVIGAAFDGYPIYGIWGFDTNGDVVEMRSSYRLKPGETGYNGIDDYEYIGDFYGDLDVCNGHFAATPEFPDGIYHYHSTIHNGEELMGFPYFLLCYYGEADMSNSNGGAQGGPDCSGFGVTWGPGIGPPPPGCENGGGGGGGGQPTTQGTVSPLSVVVASSVWLSAVMIGAVLGSLAHIATQRARSSDRSLNSHSSLGSCKSSKSQ